MALRPPDGRRSQGKMSAPRALQTEAAARVGFGVELNLARSLRVRSARAAQQMEYVGSSRPTNAGRHPIRADDHGDALRAKEWG